MKNMIVSFASLCFLIACQSAPVQTASVPPAPPEKTDDARGPTSVNDNAAIACWRNAKGMNSEIAAVMCANENGAAGYQCWRTAKGVDDRSALLLCKYSPAPADAINCWKGAKGVDNGSASILCLAETPTDAIPCWKTAKGVDAMSAALLCQSSNALADLECWRNARGVDNAAAAILCYTGSRNSPAYLAWDYVRQKKSEESSYTSGYNNGFAAGQSSCRH